MQYSEYTGDSRLKNEIGQRLRQIKDKLCELLSVFTSPKEGVDCNGNPTSVPNAILTVPHPDSVQTVKFCGTATEFDKIILCEPLTGNKVSIITSYSILGVPNSTAYNLIDASLYTGDISALEYCNDEVESDPITMCDGGLEFLRWVIKNNGIPVSKLDTTKDGFTLYVASGNETIGECLYCEPTISDAFGDDLSTLLPGNSFTITKPECSSIRVNTSIGSFTLRKNETYYSSDTFGCPITVDSISIIDGTSTLNQIHIILNKTK